MIALVSFNAISLMDASRLTKGLVVQAAGDLGALPVRAVDATTAGDVRDPGANLEPNH
jgi:hypothetical protein